MTGKQWWTRAVLESIEESDAVECVCHMASDGDVHDDRDVDLWLATGWSREAWKHCGSPQERIETGLGLTGRRNPSGSQTFQPTSSEAEVTNSDVTIEWESQHSITFTCRSCVGTVHGPCVI